MPRASASWGREHRRIAGVCWLSALLQVQWKDLIQMKNERVGYPTSPGLYSEYRSTQQNVYAHIQQACTYYKIFKEEKDACTTTNFLSVLPSLSRSLWQSQILPVSMALPFPEHRVVGIIVAFADWLPTAFYFVVIVCVFWHGVSLIWSSQWSPGCLWTQQSFSLSLPSAGIATRPNMLSSHSSPPLFLPFLYISSDSRKCHLASGLSSGLVLVATVATYSPPVCLSYLPIPQMSLDSFKANLSLWLDFPLHKWSLTEV